MNMTDVIKRYEPDLKQVEEHLGKYLHSGRIKGVKAGKSWKVLRSELDRFLRGENAWMA